MALIITETFGYPVSDNSDAAQKQRQSEICPFRQEKCWKAFRSTGKINGTCVAKTPGGPEVIICPDRLYAESLKVLKEVAGIAFGPEASLIKPLELPATQGKQNRVVAFGKRSGKELRVRKAANSDDSYSSDWMLALLDSAGTVQSFTPVEIQTMDTTGSYQREWYEINGLRLPDNIKPTEAGFNWENVNKRIIAQLLIKGNVFAREELCRRGLFFICPEPVYQNLMKRLGTTLSQFPLTSGALTFRRYQIEATAPQGEIRKLLLTGQFTTSIQNFRDAYNSTLNLPDMGIVAATIQEAIQEILKLKKGKKRKGIDPTEIASSLFS